MEYSGKSQQVHPRIIIHGGAGNITRRNLPQASYDAYRSALMEILGEANDRLTAKGDSSSALDVATYAVSLLENNPLFNSGKGAVFTRAETHELEASVMVSDPKLYRKRGVGVMKVRMVKNPILMAKEMLIRGERKDGGGAGPHVQLEGATCDRLAEKWGLEMVHPSYFWTRKRWDEHREGLGKSYDDETYEQHRRRARGDDASCSGNHAAGVDSDDLTVGDVSWDGKEYLPQGTVGAVVLDRTGTVCVATSTGGLTNKLAGRVGDTPTLGAGFWAEEWDTLKVKDAGESSLPPSSSFGSLISDCLPSLSGYVGVPSSSSKPRVVRGKRAVAMSGTGNGDSFLRLNAVRTAAAMARFTSFCHVTADSTPMQTSTLPLAAAVTAVAGPNGELQRSAEDRWRITGEGEGGIIGIDCSDGKGEVVADFNCGGMFRCWMDENGKARMAVFREAY